MKKPAANTPSAEGTTPDLTAPETTTSESSTPESSTPDTAPAANSADGEQPAATAKAGKLLSQAQQVLGQVPTSLKNLGTQTSTSFNKLTTTQKILGGTALAVGVGYLVASKKKAKKADQASTLNELLYFVNDRIAGYERAVAESTDNQLRGYYKQLVSQSQLFANELNNYLRKQNGGRQTSTTLKGKLYRAWMDAKAAVTGSDEKTILGSNIYGEEWAIKAYQDALDDKTLTGAMRLAVERQFNLSQKTYKELQKLEEKQK
jgi:uncharacterized protein (TIGR02284 family)